MDPETPTEPPPPAYESEHDYDRKISDALERSLTISNQPQHPLPLPPGEDEWEEWDEARFEVAAAAARAREQRQDTEQSRPATSRHASEKERLARQDAWHDNQTSGEASSSASSRPSVQPSRRLPVSPSTKERPSWYSEAQLDDSAASGSSQVSSSHPVHNIPPEEDDPDEPLPPFAAVGPSLEGPPFEEVVRQPPRLPPASNVDSPPQSPLDSVDSDSPERPPSSRLSGRRAYSDRYRATSPRQSLAPSLPRTPPVSSSPRPPPMRFDPSVAYAKHRNTSQFSSEAESREPVDASAFYNSSVSSLLGSSQTSKKSNALHKELSTSPSPNRIGPNNRYPQIPSVPPVPPVSGPFPTFHGAPSPSSYHPMQNQAYAPNPHAPHHFQPPSQQSQQVVPGFYGQPIMGATPVPPPPPPPPPHWHPPNTMHGGGYGR